MYEVKVQKGEKRLNDDRNMEAKMELNSELIKEFVKKQNMGSADRWMQLTCVIEEATELRKAMFYQESIDRRVEEMADVLVTVLVYAEIEGVLDKISEAFEEKMKVNLKKPVRKEIGVKVSK